MNARPRDFDPATDEHWLERARDQAIQDCKDHSATALYLLEPPSNPLSAELFYGGFAAAVMAAMSGDGKPWVAFVKALARQYADERAPELARKLYEIAYKESLEP